MVAPAFSKSRSLITNQTNSNTDGHKHTNVSAILSEGDLKETNQLEPKVHGKYTANMRAQNSKQKDPKKADLLKRCKSNIQEDDYDTVIIEEEYFSPNRRKQLQGKALNKDKMMKSLST